LADGILLFFNSFTVGYFVEEYDITLSFLKSLYLRESREELKQEFPFNLPMIKNFEEVTFGERVNFFVGDNGTGKSTLLECMALAIELQNLGSFRKLDDDHEVDDLELLPNHLRLNWRRKTKHGFFLRAEDFLGFKKRIRAEIGGLEEEVAEVQKSFSGGDIDLILGPIKAERDQFVKKYGPLSSTSHGEGFLHLFKNRLKGDGIYLIDEPEAALSPIKQLSLLSLILDLVNQNKGQFFIATHSPILMALPGATIWDFNNHPLKKVSLKDVAHFRITRDFLNNPELFLKHLQAHESD
jgi:predicted ATPase